MLPAWSSRAPLFVIGVFVVHTFNDNRTHKSIFASLTCRSQSPPTSFDTAKLLYVHSEPPSLSCPVLSCRLVYRAGIPKGPRVKLLYALRTKRHPPKSGDLTVMRTFLTSLGLERYSKAFEEGEVDMGAVDVMEEADYAQLGVAKVYMLSIY